MPLLRGALVGGAAYSMGKRSAASAPREQSPKPPGGTDVASRLAQLNDLMEQGVLTSDEFAQAKAKLLAG
jgi:hypothetical protein